MTEGQAVSLICMVGFGGLFLTGCLAAWMEYPSDNELRLAFVVGMTLSALTTYLFWRAYKSFKNQP